MKKTILLFLLFTLLGGATYWYVNQSKASAVSGRYDLDFTIEDTEQIHKIFIASRRGTSYELKRQGKSWIVNGKYKVRPGKIDFILETLRRQRVKFIPTQKASANVVKNIAGTGLKIELYDEKDQPIKIFYVGGMTNDELGTYMILAGSNQPMVVHIPSWEGGLRTRFWDDPENWRDRSVFNYNPKNIEYVKVDYPRQKSDAFELEKTAEGFSVRPLYKTTAVINSAVSEEQVDRYLKDFTSIVAENFSNDFLGRDSITQLIPFCSITVREADETTKTVDFYPQSSAVEYSSPETSTQVLAGRGQIERYFAETTEGDFIVVQQIVVGKLFKPYPSFFMGTVPK